MRRRKYLSIAASGTALAVAGCFGSDDNDGGGDDGSDDTATDDETGDDGGDTGEQDDGENESDDQSGSLQEPMDVVVTNDHANDYTFDVAVSDDSGATVFEDEVSLASGETQTFEDVVSEPGTYTVEATKGGSVSRSTEFEVSDDMGDVRIHVAENGEYTIEEA